MTHDEKINWMRMAGSMARLNLDEHHCDLLVCLYECVIQKQGQTSLKDVADIEDFVQERKRMRTTSQMLDQISKKVP